MVLSTTTMEVGFAVWTSVEMSGISQILMSGLVGDSRRTSLTFWEWAVRIGGKEVSGVVVSRWCTVMPEWVERYLSSRLDPPYRSSPAMTWSPGERSRVMTSMEAMPEETTRHRWEEVILER